MPKCMHGAKKLTYLLLISYLVFHNDLTTTNSHYETQDMKLAEDKLVFVYTEVMQNSCYSEKYAEFFKKSLHYCIPF